MLLHIHGFNSSPASNTFRLLCEAFPQARALAYACDGLFADNLASLHQQALECLTQAAASDAQAASPSSAHATPLVISGSSLGGFYASQLAALLHAAQGMTACHCALFNPVVYPATALRPFLGRNTLRHSGEEWEFTPAMLESYAHFTDTRQVGAPAAPRNNSGNGHVLRRFVLLGRNDSLLNPAEARTYWQHCAQIHETDDEHSIAALDAVTVGVLRDWGAGGQE